MELLSLGGVIAGMLLDMSWEPRETVWRLWPVNVVVKFGLWETLGVVQKMMCLVRYTIQLLRLCCGGLGWKLDGWRDNILSTNISWSINRQHQS